MGAGTQTRQTPVTGWPRTSMTTGYPYTGYGGFTGAYPNYGGWGGYPYGGSYGGYGNNWGGFGGYGGYPTMNRSAFGGFPGYGYGGFPRAFPGTTMAVEEDED